MPHSPQPHGPHTPHSADLHSDHALLPVQRHVLLHRQLVRAAVPPPARLVRAPGAPALGPTLGAGRVGHTDRRRAGHRRCGGRERERRRASASAAASAAPADATAAGARRVGGFDRDEQRRAI
eukprot:497192-Prymnesium_polylepis.1